MTPSAAGRIGAHTKWGKTPDRRAATEPARTATHLRAIVTEAIVVRAFSVIEKNISRVRGFFEQGF